MNEYFLIPKIGFALNGTRRSFFRIIRNINKVQNPDQTHVNRRGCIGKSLRFISFFRSAVLSCLSQSYLSFLLRLIIIQLVRSRYLAGNSVIISMYGFMNTVLQLCTVRCHIFFTKNDHLGIFLVMNNYLISSIPAN